MALNYPFLEVPGAPTSSVDTWSSAVINSMTALWAQLMAFVPNLLAALIVFIIGWAIAVTIGRVVEKLVAILRINQAVENFRGVRAALSRAGMRLDIPYVVGAIAKWFLIIVFLLAATDILQLQEVSQFLRSVLYYIPNVVVAALIMVIAMVLANFVYGVVSASITAAGFTTGPVVAAISKWAIIIFAIFAALLQLQVAVALIQTLITALFAMIALAGGLAFGLGGRDMAAKWLEKAENDLTGNRRRG